MLQSITQSAYFGVIISLAAFWLGTCLKRKFSLAIFNPLLVSVVLTCVVLVVLKIDYKSYQASGKYLSYLLTPTTICLAIPLYEQLHLLKKNTVAILCGIAAGAATSLVCVGLFGVILKLSKSELVTLLPNSVTTAIGVPIAEKLGGYEAITAIVIILTGVTGNIFAEGFLKLIRVTNPIAKGIAIGTASHSIGTTKALELGEIEGAMSSLSIAVAGIMTVIMISVFEVLHML